ncbi:hypothetical protein G6F26_010194 [Rhizopus arrhizus]|nr:hypothetical protein G6F26_010194 [Rhizopus arrhizus]
MILNWQFNSFTTLLTVNTVQNLKNLLLKKFLEYFRQPSSKKQFLEYYLDCERKLRLQNSAARLEEVKIAGNEFVGDHLREKVEKRKLNDLVVDTDTRPLKIQIKSKTYDIQSPQNAAVLDSPVIEKSILNILSRRVDICLWNNTNFASPELLEEYRGLQDDHRKNLNLLKVDYSMDFFSKFLEFDEERLLDSIAEMTYDGSFNRFLKFSLIDFAVNMKRITPMPVMDERTMYVETISQMFKYFGNITGLLSFKCENNNTSIVIESSGLNISANFDHALEDSVKNIKSGTDALKGIMCKYPNASRNTMERVHVYSVHVIQTSMTLIRYSLKNTKSWKAVDCGSAILPLVFKERKRLIQVYDIFALLYADLQEQRIIFQILEDEQLGLLGADDLLT